MASNSKTRSSAHLWEVNAILLLGISLVLFLSFISFEGNDISWIKEPPNPTAHNFVGVFGAWTAYLLALPFGNAVWILFAICLGYGVTFLFAGERMGLRQLLWTTVMLLSGCGLFDILNVAPSSPLALHNCGPGGFIGMFIARTLLAPVAPAGPYIILPVVWLISIVMLTGFRPLHSGAQLAIWLREQWEAEKVEKAGSSKPELRTDLLRQQRELERQAKELERTSKKAAAKLPVEAEEKEKEKPKGKEKAKEEPVPEPVVVPLPPQEITIRDHSRPTPTINQATIPTVATAGKESAAKALALAANTQTPPALKAVPKPEPKPEPKKETKIERPVLPPPAPVIKEVKAPEPVIKEVEKLEPLEELAAVVNPGTAEIDTDEIPPISRPPVPAAPAKPAAPKPPVMPVIPEAPISYKDFRLPNTDLLNKAKVDNAPIQVVEDLKQNAAILQATLADFGIDVRVGDVTKGPAITRYELYPGQGVKVEKITALQNNIALALKASSVRILAPIPGKAAVGIEVPNSSTTMVYLRDVIESKEWKASTARLPLALGKDISGNVLIGDLADMPHLLVAGTTGSGKTVCINAIITGLLFRFTPEELKFVFVDPKVVEMQMFNSLPHMALPVITDPKKVLLALRWLLSEMEKRYQIFSKVGVRNIHGFNTRSTKPNRNLPPKPDDGEQMELSVPRDFELKIPEKLPYIVLIVDELADLMMTAPADIETAIARLAQLARATGIHMILATQRPSVNVITGVIKANVPARIAFQVASKQDSRVILDANGADKLLGKGDMLYLPPGSSKLNRAQGVYVQDEEIRGVTEFCQQAPPTFEKSVTEKLIRETPAGSSDGGSEEDEELVQKCIDVIQQTERASVSILQRRLRIGYTRAARIMDILEERGVVGPHKGAEPRDILIDLDGGIPANTEE